MAMRQWICIVALFSAADAARRASVTSHQQAAKCNGVLSRYVCRDDHEPTEGEGPCIVQLCTENQIAACCSVMEKLQLSAAVNSDENLETEDKDEPAAEQVEEDAEEWKDAEWHQAVEQAVEGVEEEPAQEEAAQDEAIDDESEEITPEVVEDDIETPITEEEMEPEAEDDSADSTSEEDEIDDAILGEQEDPEDSSVLQESGEMTFYEQLKRVTVEADNVEEFRQRAAQPAPARFMEDESASLLEMESVRIISSGTSTKRWVTRWQGKISATAKPVGKGAFGKVYIGSVACDGTKVAIKQMRGQSAKPSDVAEEVNSMKAFSGSPHFVTYFDHDLGQDKSHYIMMEAALGDTLAKIIDGRKRSSSNDQMQLFFDMVEGVSEMHARSIVHRDLKPANVFVSRTCGGEIPCHSKVGDLGLACITSGSVRGVPKCRGVAGTPLYIAPETYKSGVIDPANDVWAMGLMLYELRFGDLPRKIAMSRSMNDLERNVKSFNIATDANFKTIASGPLKELLQGMLTNNYNRRMSAAGAVPLARGMVTSMDADVVGALSECYHTGVAPTPAATPSPTRAQPALTPQKPQRPVIRPVAPEKPQPQPVAPAVDEDWGQEGGMDVDFFDIHQAKTNIGTNFAFNKDIIEPSTGLVVATDKKLEQLKQKGYFKTPLQNGDIVLEVNDIAWSALTDHQREMLKNGMMGAALTFKYARR